MSGRPLYKSYVFKDKDPVIDELRTMVVSTFGEVSHRNLKRIEHAGGPTASAMMGWFFGDTCRPQSPTVEAAGRTMGWKRKWVKMNGKGK